MRITKLKLRLTLGAFCQNRIFQTLILEIFRQDKGQISSKRHLQDYVQQAFLSTSIAFWGIFVRVCLEIQILRSKVFQVKVTLNNHICFSTFSESWNALQQEIQAQFDHPNGSPYLHNFLFNLQIIIITYCSQFSSQIWKAVFALHTFFSYFVFYLTDQEPQRLRALRCGSSLV